LTNPVVTSGSARTLLIRTQLPHDAMSSTEEQGEAGIVNSFTTARS
jgi:hypothetical protein